MSLEEKEQIIKNSSESSSEFTNLELLRNLLNNSKRSSRISIPIRESKFTRDMGIISFSYNKILRGLKRPQGTLNFSKREQEFKFGIKFEKEIQILNRTTSKYLDSTKHLVRARELIKSFPMKYDFHWFIQHAISSSGIDRDIYYHFGQSLYKQRCLDVARSRNNFEVDLDLYRDMCDPFYSDTGKDSYLIEYRMNSLFTHPELVDYTSELRFTHSRFFDSMPFWNHPIDDYKYALKPPKELSEVAYTSFRDTLYKRLRKIKISPEYNDLINRKLKKSSIFDISEGKNIRRYTISDITEKYIRILESKEIIPWVFNRTQIPVSNGNIRDTFVPSVETFCQMIIIEDICSQICERIPEIKIGKEFIPLESKYGSSFSMIDIKKFGLTFPRELLKLSMEVISDVYSIDLSWIIDSFNHSYVYINGDKREILRGFGLGNLNFLSTLAYWTICKSTGYKFFVYSDDVIFFHDSEEIEITRIEKLLQSFNLELNLKKCYQSKIPEFLGFSPSNSFLEYAENLLICKFASSIFSDDDLECYQKEVQLLNEHPNLLKKVFFYNHIYRKVLDNRLLNAPDILSGYIHYERPERWLESHYWSKDWKTFKPPDRQKKSYTLDRVPFLGLYTRYYKPYEDIVLQKELSNRDKLKIHLKFINKLRQGKEEDPTSLEMIFEMYNRGIFPESTLEFDTKKRRIELLGIKRIPRGSRLNSRGKYFQFKFDPQNEMIKTLQAFTDFPVETWAMLSFRYNKYIERSKFITNGGNFQFREYIFYREEDLPSESIPYIKILGMKDEPYHIYSRLDIKFDKPSLMDIELPEESPERRRKMKGNWKIPNLLGNLPIIPSDLSGVRELFSDDDEIETPSSMSSDDISDYESNEISLNCYQEEEEVPLIDLNDLSLDDSCSSERGNLEEEQEIELPKINIDSFFKNG